MKNGTILVMRHAEKSSDPLDPDLTPVQFDFVQSAIQARSVTEPF
jgi:hypothetical protein